MDERPKIDYWGIDLYILPHITFESDVVHFRGVCAIDNDVALLRGVCVKNGYRSDFVKKTMSALSTAM